MAKIGGATCTAFFTFIVAIMPAFGDAGPDYVKSYTPPAPLKYQVDIATLRNAGINVRLLRQKRSDPMDGLYAAGPPFPHKCFHEADRELTLSDKFFEHYSARGFSLSALCLAVSAGGWVHYDLETGKPLRVLYARPHDGYLLDVPDCFKNGVPFLDCKRNFEHGFGLKLTAAARKSEMARYSGIDEAVQALVASGKFSRECTCDDLEAYKEPSGGTPPVIQIKGSGYGGAKPAEPYSCRVEAMPTCASNWLKGRDVGGWMLYEVADGYLFNGVPTKGFTDVGPFEISPKLPHGYAYQIGHPEGEDDTPFAEVTPGTKLSVGD